MRCATCNRPIALGELAISCESGRQSVGRYGNPYFEGNEDTVAHARCSPWFDMKKNFLNQCNEVTECACCSTRIGELDLMVRLRVGVASIDNDIKEMDSQFVEVYLHPECAMEYFDEEWLFWND